VTTIHLKTRIEPTPEIMCVLNISHKMYNGQHNCNVMRVSFLPKIKRAENDKLIFFMRVAFHNIYIRVICFRKALLG